ncbi:MAG: hypothetical protein ACLRJC_00595 [Emergencia timonensis]|uniref:hypothetical protein n=1 Tax=Emergencia timonensis TaxID=1776384 RepID=UPI00082DB2A9|nr:hypothetical protein [Emergencia timonensis]WNX89935.1 hypothetical protein RVY71_06575 [Emergencia timonensis]
MFANTAALHRLLQAINWQGSVYSFQKPGVNVYGEKTDDIDRKVMIRGLFHNGSSEHVKLTVSDGGTVIEKNTPYIMTAWVNAERLQLDDQVIINGRAFKVTGRTNIGEYNIVGEISLEVIL